VRIAVISVLVLGIVGLLCFRASEAFRSGSHRIGIRTDQGSEGIVALEVPAGTPAELGGVRRGDEIVEVGGRRIRTLAGYQWEVARFRHGQPVELLVRRQGELLTLSVVPGVRPSWNTWAAFGIDALTAFCYLGIALLALFQGAGDLRSRLLFSFSLAVAVELALPPAGSAGSLWIRPLYLAAYYVLTGLQMGLELHLASLIPERPAWLRARPWVVPLYYVVGLGLGTATCASYVSEEVLGRRIFPWSSDSIGSFMQDFGLVGWAVAVSLLLLSQALRHADGAEAAGRHQAGLVLAGTLPWFLFLLASSVLTRLGWQPPAWTGALESLVLLCYPLALFAAIYRYHLFDIELVMRRSLIYATLTGAVILLFYAALGAGGFLFSRLVEGGERSVWVVSASTLLLGLLVSPLRRALQRLIDRRFFPERQALRRRLVALASELPALGKLPRMGQHLVVRLTAIFGARSATLLIADPETGLLSVLAATGEQVSDSFLPLDDPAVEILRKTPRPQPSAQLAAKSPGFAQRVPGLDPAGLVVPLVSQEMLIGILLVGRKEGKSTYPGEELDLLNLLAHHVATVFENARLFASATYEGLTGLLRREAILEQLDKELERALRYRRPLTIAMADLDHFKEVNDRYGHLGGDTLLRRIAQVVAGALRSTDWVGRYGGEEFLLVLPETDIGGAAGVAEKVRSLVQRTRVTMEDGSSMRVTLSIGLAALDNLQGITGRVTARDLIAAADRSLYEAKHGGRNRVHPLVAVA